MVIPPPPSKLSFPPPTPTPPRLPPISIYGILTSDHSWTASLSAYYPITLVTTGDILTARAINIRARQSQNFGYPFDRLRDFLSSSDLTFINLEAPLVDNCPDLPTGTKFCGLPDFAPAIAATGIDVVSLANNHTVNFGVSGLSSTISFLRAAGLAPVGLGQPEIFTVRDQKVAFLAFNDVGGPYPGIAQATPENIALQTATARQQADIVVIQFHWGNEYTTRITPRQQSLARLAIDSGADLVIGNHPHWVQPLEIYQEKLIAYSHGNFVFDQNWSQKTRRGVVGKYTFLNSRLVDAQFFAVVISPEGIPDFAPSPQSETILTSLQP